MTITKLTEKELFGVQFLWRHMSDVSCLEPVISWDILHPYFSALKKHRVVEIGPGNNPITNHYKCKEYVAAEGYYPNDGLSILKKEGDASAVVVSFGVIDDDILKDKINRVREELSTRYINELVREIRRVMNPFAIIVGADAGKYMEKSDIPILDTDPKIGGIYLSHHR